MPPLPFKNFVSWLPDFGDTWAKREKLADKTEKTNFGCEFKCGACVAQRRGLTDAVKACCHGCANNFGYQLRNRINPKAVATLEKLFDPILGFWRAGQGCALPRKYRSATCLSFHCATASAKTQLPEWLESLRSKWWDDKFLSKRPISRNIDTYKRSHP